MRGYLFLIISLFFLVSSCKNKQKERLNAPENALPIDLRPSLEKKPKMVFEQPIVYLGRITEGDSITYTFNFKNKGNLPLKILSVNASCGCTTPKWSQELVQPGKKGFIKVISPAHQNHQNFKEKGENTYDLRRIGSLRIGK